MDDLFYRYGFAVGAGYNPQDLVWETAYMKLLAPYPEEYIMGFADGRTKKDEYSVFLWAPGFYFGKSMIGFLDLFEVGTIITAVPLDLYCSSYFFDPATIIEGVHYKWRYLGGNI